MSLRRWPIVGLAVAVAVSVFSITSGALPSARADGCPNVQLIFARGTAEPPGLGVAGDALLAALQHDLGSRNVDAYAVDYPASYNFLQTADGANDARDHIAQMVDQCPATKLVLGGFSQGAAAVSMLAGVPPLGNTVGNFGSAPELDPGLANKVRAVAVFGNPGNRFNTPLSTTGLFAGRAIDICSPGDPVCVVGGRDREAHHDYGVAPYPGQAAGFIAGLV
ncbi:cutinase family protein [Mycobacterium europaeum]|uniref:Cutinase Cut3 n=1 Tax=Mycobacterium europaeum TaxID=761804 RepID=A0A0U1DPF4_9MYCO|nr:cutinase family protein [Mycobacterium europaeum]MEA1159893.1 cutinase family protein [Mycobacterium europaeum]ORV56273.1 cutinase [Mycobacterium europaeum]CQD19572.1 cutinase Cut3 [Mycobacterium europaeum]